MLEAYKEAKDQQLAEYPESYDIQEVAIKHVVSVGSIRLSDGNRHELIQHDGDVELGYFAHTVA